MVELRKTGVNQYEVVADEQVIGQVWNWHGSWSAQADGETHHGLKSRKEAIARVEDIHRLRAQQYEGPLPFEVYLSTLDSFIYLEATEDKIS